VRHQAIRNASVFVSTDQFIVAQSLSAAGSRRELSGSSLMNAMISFIVNPPSAVELEVRRIRRLVSRTALRAQKDVASSTAEHTLSSETRGLTAREAPFGLRVGVSAEPRVSTAEGGFTDERYHRIHQNLYPKVAPRTRGRRGVCATMN